MAADFQTLFFWDESTSTEKIGRLKGTIGFFEVKDLGARPGAQPNDACTRIYFSNGSSIAVATAN